MRAMLALIHREYLEHKGAFLFAPAVLLVLFTAVMTLAISLGRVRPPVNIVAATARQFYEFAFLGISGMWFVYLMVALFFYYAQAFSADRRNNAMLFWKSMPQSDFTILMSKLLAGMTLLPALIFAVSVVTGLVLYGLTGLAAGFLPQLGVADFGELVLSSVRIGGATLAYLVLAMLWYAPFFAWVGALSTVAGRWSMPLAFLIPALLGLIEKLLFPGEGPERGYVLSYLSERFHFGPDGPSMMGMLFGGQGFDTGRMIEFLFASIDWAQLAGGLIVAVVLVYAASEYRRRVVLT